MLAEEAAPLPMLEMAVNWPKEGMAKAAIIKTLNKAATNPEVMEKLKAMALVPANRNAAAFETQWLSEMKSWQEVLKGSDFKPIELGN